ncbi:Npun_F0813 family protein [Halomicronema sp. CCY15110]|uniref:Npun_F0813 family protein n=1 Tax=Halomicronema sp. CCY15110 TaxID=2767773 RepID=UPI0019519D0F|nr:Npun_F0813 family protein [Halomicronema sp. CCY15110]
MFILKRQDVEIKNVQHPSKEQPIPILYYQGQTFRLLSVFTAAQEEEAMALWRDLTDNRGKACVLLEEPERFSIWGKIRLDALDQDTSQGTDQPAAQALIQGCLLILQALFLDIEDLLGAKQANLFESEISRALMQWHFPQVPSEKAVKTLLTMDPLATQVPPWEEHHLQRLLEEMHRLGKDAFGNANFTERSLEALEDLSNSEQKQFTGWLSMSPSGKLWR